MGPRWLITTSLGEVGCYMGLAESSTYGKTRKGNTKGAEWTPFSVCIHTSSFPVTRDT